MSGKWMKKSASIMSVLALTVAMTACVKPGASPGGQSPGAAPGTPPAAAPSTTPGGGSGEGTTIVFQTFLKPDGTSPREKALAQIVKNFTDKTGIQVKYVVLPWQEVDSQLLLSVQAGNPPDVSYVRDRSFEKHIQADSLLPLDDFIKKDIPENDQKDFLLWDQVGVHDGRKYTFATSFIADAMFIRKDMLDKTGLQVPKTWDEFVKVGKALTTPGVSGYIIGSSPVQANQLDWVQPMIEGRGGKVLDDQGKAAFDSQAGIDTFKYLKSLVYEHKIMPANAATMKYDDVTDAFSSGRIGMIFEGSHRYAQIANAVKPENLIVAQMPGKTPDQPSPTAVNGWTLGIPKNSPNAEAAWKFIHHFTSPESVLLYSKISGEIPIRTSTTKDAFFQSPEGEMTSRFVQYINEGSTLAVAPATAGELAEIFANALQEVLSDPNSDVETIVKSAAKKYNELVK